MRIKFSKKKLYKYKMGLRKFFKKLNFYLFYIRHYPQTLIKAPYFFITLGPKGFLKKMKEKSKYENYAPTTNLPFLVSLRKLISLLFSPQKILKGVKILNAEVFAESLQHSGFILDRIIKRRIPSKILPQKRDQKTGRFASNHQANSEAYPIEYIIIGLKG